MADPVSFRIWDHAYPARQARRMALSKDQRAELDHLLSQSAASGFMSDVEASLAEAESGMDALRKAASGVATITTERQELLKQGQNKILAGVRKGIVIALAYEAPRKLSDLPAEVPAEVICTARSLDWDAGTLKAAGLHLVELRFLPKQRADDIRAAASPAPAKKAADPPKAAAKGVARPVGRPPIGPYIEEAFRVLLASGEIDLSASMRSHYPRVRAWLEKEHPEAITQPGAPGDEAIRKTIAPLFRDAKKSTHKL